MVGIRPSTGSTRPPVLVRQLCPIASETLAIPLRDRIRVDDEQATHPSWPRGAQSHPEDPVNVIEQRTWSLALYRGYLLTQGKILGQEVSL